MAWPVLARNPGGRNRRDPDAARYFVKHEVEKKGAHIRPSDLVAAVSLSTDPRSIFFAGAAGGAGRSTGLAQAICGWRGIGLGMECLDADLRFRLKGMVSSPCP